MSDLSEAPMTADELKSDQQLYEEARGLNDKAALDLNTADKRTLLHILDAMRVYCLTERNREDFGDEFSDIMGSIARKLNRSVW